MLRVARGAAATGSHDQAGERRVRGGHTAPVPRRSAIAALALLVALAAAGCGKSADPAEKRAADAIRHDRYLPTPLIDTVKCTRAQDVYACAVSFRDGRTARCTVATYNGAVEGLSCTRPRRTRGATQTGTT